MFSILVKIENLYHSLKGFYKRSHPSIHIQKGYSNASQNATQRKAT